MKPRKKLSVYHDKECVEVFLHLGGQRGLYLTLERWDKRSFRVEVLRATNGCPGTKPAEFSRTYRES